jgi:hypothetical protein
MNERKTDERDPIQTILKAGALYFAVVFAAGFVLGTIRTLWVVPSFGARGAELTGGAHHVRDHRSRIAMGGSASCHTTFIPQADCCRPGRAWPLASYRIHRCALD